LPQVVSGQLEWGVPGFLEEKIVAMIRSLPKSIRRSLIPAPDTARRVAGELAFGQGDFFEQTITKLSEIAHEPIPKDAFQLDKLPPHLRVNYRIVDGDGKMLTEGRDLDAIRESLGVEMAVEVDHPEDNGRWNRDGMTGWDFGELPQEISILRNNVELAAFPALLDGGDTVQMRLLNSADLARRETRAGIRRLYVIQKRKALRSQVSWLPRFNEICVLAAPLISKEALADQVRDLIADRAFFGRGEKMPRDAESFAARLANSAERIGVATQDVAKLLPKLFDAFQEARLAVEQCGSPKWRYAVDDVRRQLDGLLPDRFLLSAPWMWLVNYPRYLKGIAYRLQRLPAGATDRDQAATEEIGVFSQRYLQRHDELAAQRQASDELETYRWMIEEFRVSLFAQPLGTSMSISAKRLDRQWTRATA
jgi:ATP-dependent helicase HrpA